MSYDISIVNEEGETLTSPETHNIAGGTYQYGGTTELWLNITSNYHKNFVKVFGKEGIHVIDGKEVKETLPLIDKAIEDFGEVSPSNDYWESSDGNAKQALIGLRTLADMAMKYFPTEKLFWKNAY